MRIIHQHKILSEHLHATFKAMLEFVVKFEELYCQRKTSQIHFVWPCLHTLIHAEPEVIQVGPGIIASQWTMERAIGDLGGEIRLPSNLYANLSQRAVRCCQVNAIKAMVPTSMNLSTHFPEVHKTSEMAMFYFKHERDMPVV